MSDQDMIKGTFYLVVGKKPGYMAALSSPKITLNKPTIPKGKIALRLVLKLPKSLFEEFIPSGTIVLPEDASIGRPAIEVKVPKDLLIDHKIELALVEYDPQEASNGQA